MTTPDAGLLALALDDLFLGLTPADAATIRVAAADDSTGLADQMKAAALDADRLRGQLATALSGRSGLVAVRDVPDWLRLGVWDTFAAWLTGQASTCMHSPTPRRPQPVHAAAGKPRLVVCSACMHLLRFSRVADRTCDVCGTVCDTIWPGMITLGLISYAWGVCQDCHDSTGALVSTVAQLPPAPAGW